MRASSATSSSRCRISSSTEPPYLRLSRASSASRVSRRSSRSGSGVRFRPYRPSSADASFSSASAVSTSARIDPSPGSTRSASLDGDQRARGDVHGRALARVEAALGAPDQIVQLLRVHQPQTLAREPLLLARRESGALQLGRLELVQLELSRRSRRAPLCASPAPAARRGAAGSAGASPPATSRGRRLLSSSSRWLSIRRSA